MLILISLFAIALAALVVLREASASSLASQSVPIPVRVSERETLQMASFEDPSRWTPN